MTTLHLPKLCLDSELKSLKGTYLDDGWILHAIDYDCDVFDSKTGKKVLSFRKRALKGSEQQLKNFVKLSRPSRGRGPSAGPIDPTSVYWSKKTLVNTRVSSTGYLKEDGTPSKMNVSNNVFSTPIGYFNSIKSLGVDLPCRLSHYTQTHMKEYEGTIPYLEEIGTWYKQLNKDAYDFQMERAMLRPQFRIGETPFSTVTVNRTFRTGLHKDGGDYGGVACLSVLEHGEYNGGIFLMPAYGIGIDLRHGDILVADVHQFHANTEMWTTPEQDARNALLPKIHKDNMAVGTLGAGTDYARISMVCYLREKIILCPDQPQVTYGQ